MLEAELLGARAVAHDQRVTEGERVAGLEVGADALAADVRRGEPEVGEERLGAGGLHPSLRVAHVAEHRVRRRRRRGPAGRGLDQAPEQVLSDNVGMTRDTPAFGTLNLEHASTVDRVVEELRRAVFDGELEAGTPLREVALADSLGVSRSTVREALAVLVGEGLATREPNRGVHVAEADPDSVRDVCRARVGARGGRRTPLDRRLRGAAGRGPAGADRLHRRGPRRRVLPAAQREAPGHPPVAGRPAGLAAAGGHRRGAQRRAAAGAGPDRPDPPQRPRPGRLAQPPAAPARARRHRGGGRRDRGAPRRRRGGDPRRARSPPRRGEPPR